jgi:hypothetical protein
MWHGFGCGFVGFVVGMVVVCLVMFFVVHCWSDVGWLVGCWVLICCGSLVFGAGFVWWFLLGRWCFLIVVVVCLGVVCLVVVLLFFVGRMLDGCFVCVFDCWVVCCVFVCLFGPTLRPGTPRDGGLPGRSAPHAEIYSTTYNTHTTSPVFFHYAYITSPDFVHFIHFDFTNTTNNNTHLTNYSLHMDKTDLWCNTLKWTTSDSSGPGPAPGQNCSSNKVLRALRCKCSCTKTVHVHLPGVCRQASLTTLPEVPSTPGGRAHENWQESRSEISIQTMV